MSSEQTNNAEEENGIRTMRGFGLHFTNGNIIRLSSGYAPVKVQLVVSLRFLSTV